MTKAARDRAGEGGTTVGAATQVSRAGSAAVIALDGALLRRAQEALGRQAVSSLPAEIHLAEGDPLAALAALLEPDAGGDGGPLADAGVRRGLLDGLARGLLLRGSLPAGPQPPRRLLQAEAWLGAKGHAVGLGSLARALGVGSRTLQRDFLRWRGCTPSAARGAMRLERARARLLAPTEALTVTEVAVEAGFGTPSRFSAAYRARFGEPPGATLRAARRRGGTPTGED